MTPQLNIHIARERTADLERAAQRHSLARLRGAAIVSDPATIAIRFAQPDEADTVRRLAILDEAPALEGDVLLALVDGEAVAALSLADGRSVATPFALTRDVVSLLRLRAKHLGANARRRRRPSLRLRRRRLRFA